MNKQITRTTLALLAGCLAITRCASSSGGWENEPREGTTTVLLPRLTVPQPIAKKSAYEQYTPANQRDREVNLTPGGWLESSILDPEGYAFHVGNVLIQKIAYRRRDEGETVFVEFKVYFHTQRGQDKLVDATFEILDQSGAVVSTLLFPNRSNLGYTVHQKVEETDSDREKFTLMLPKAKLEGARLRIKMITHDDS